MGGNRQVILAYVVEFTAQFIHTFWCSMATYPASKAVQLSAAEILNSTSLSSLIPLIKEDEVKSSSDYFESVFMPAIQAGVSVWMQITWSSRIGAAHFNPAVSFGFLVAGVIKPIKFFLFVVVQCLASILAALFAKALGGGVVGAVTVPEDASGVIVAFNEVFVTGYLMFFILCVAMDDKFSEATGALAIGFTVFQGILSSKAVGVACISPSFAIGGVVVNGGAAWRRHWIFWLADLGGAGIAAIYYMCMFAPDDKCWLERKKQKRSSVRKDDDDDEEDEHDRSALHKTHDHTNL